MPQSPGVQVHASFGKQRGGVEVVGKLVNHLSHRITIVLSGFPQIGLSIRRETLGQRLDIGTIAARYSVRSLQRLLHGFVGSLVPVGVGRIVVVRSYSFSDTPIR